jgi:D-glycero-alpha-D-manno-heptose 1-phosphate guanylyltransferase
MKLLVLAGGFGTRLRTVVKDLPKPLAPIGNEPFLKLQIKQWLSQDVTSFIFLLHYKANLIIDFIKAEQSDLLSGCEVQYLVESAPMGTGGAVAHAVARLQLEEELLVVNADTWLGGGMKDMRASSAPALALVHVTNTARYGTVEFNENRLVSSFKEKNLSASPGWINAGLYRINPLDFAASANDPFSLENTYFPKLAAKGVLQAVPLSTEFVDIGIPEDYHRLCRQLNHK